MLLLAALAAGCGANIGAPIDVQPFTIESTDWSPAWSPDGRGIAYLHFTAPGKATSRIGIWIADTAGVSRHEIRAGIWNDLDWTPDGTHFVICGGPVQSLRAAGDSLWTIVPNGVRAHWSPDGSRLAFHTIDSTGTGSITIVSRDGTVMQSLRPPAGESWVEPDWSPDGTRLVHIRRLGGKLNQADVFVMDTTGHGWVAYFSNESGRAEVYVSPFPGPGPTTQVSTAGGLNARWSRDGKEIYYHSPDGQLMAAAVSASRQRFDLGDVKPLFALPRVARRWSLDVSPDGRRFLAVTQRPQAGTEPLTLVQNWPALTQR